MPVIFSRERIRRVSSQLNTTQIRVSNRMIQVGEKKGERLKLKEMKRASATRIVISAVLVRNPRARSLWWIWQRSGRKGLLCLRTRWQKTLITSSSGMRRGGDGEYEKIFGGVGSLVGAEVEHRHGEKGEDGADGERAGVAHEYLRMVGGVAEDVVVEEWHEGAECGSGEHRVDVFSCLIEDIAVIGEGDGAESGGETVDAVDEVDGIDHEDCQKDGGGDSEPGVDSAYAKESEEVADVETRHGDERSGYDLEDEFAAIAHSDEVVGDSGEIHQHQGADEEEDRHNSLVELHAHDEYLRAEVDGEHDADGEDEGGEEGDAAETGHSPLMDFAFVDFVEKLAAEGYEEHFGDYESRQHRREREADEVVFYPESHDLRSVSLFPAGVADTDAGTGRKGEESGLHRDELKRKAGIIMN